MGKLNIAHHKSYHPYRADNIARVKRDEEEAKLKVSAEEDRAQVAEAEGRIDILRKRVGIIKEPTNREEDDLLAGPSSVGPSSSPSTSVGKHINLFEDIEQHSAVLNVRAAKKSIAIPESDRGFALAPSKKDLTPWYTSKRGEGEVDERDGRRMRDYARKSHADPLASIPAHIKYPSKPSSSRPARIPPSSSDFSSLDSRLTRESSERERAQALIRRKQKERERLEGSATPSTVRGGYGDVYNRVEVEEAHRGWGRKGWQRNRELKDRRWDDDGGAHRRGR